MPDTRGLPATIPLTAAGLADVAGSLAAQAPLWLAVARDSASPDPIAPTDATARAATDDPDDGDQPWGTRIASGTGWEAWLHTWEHGQVGELHAHDSLGAIAVLDGALLEDVPAGTSRILEPGDVHTFPAGHRHGLAALAGPAVSVHVVARAFTHTRPVRRRTDDTRTARRHTARSAATRSTR